MNYEMLDWDSDFFGIQVARITEPVLTTAELTSILAELKRQRVELVYWPSSIQFDCDEIRGLGGHLVDNKTTFVIDFRQFDLDAVVSTDIVVPYSPSMPFTDVEDLAVQSSEYSRFAVDPRFPRERLVALYKTWIERSIRKEIASEVLVIREGNRIVGMVTIGEKNGRGDIGLIAVDARCRGKNYGEILVWAAQVWFVKNGYQFGQVVTQGRNVPACNLYKKCGYSIERVEYFYHFWLCQEISDTLFSGASS
jgi:dTDP-4-amino-4,6-dideoxy-D-galactose acyltransferase